MIKYFYLFYSILHYCIFLGENNREVKNMQVNPDRISKKKKIKKITDDIAQVWTNTNAAIPVDVDGSYTGTPEEGETPVQDADDL